MVVPVIETRGLIKSYRTGEHTIPVLRDVSMSVDRGECLFLVGPSGSGKTTLLSILGCVLSADSGDIRILGHDVKHLRPDEQAEFRREKIGFVFQRLNLFDALTALENVCIPLQLLRWKKAAAISRSRQLLDSLGLGSLINRNVTQLSMGQRQRVAVARALAADPELILADEPTASLDESSGLQAIATLKDLCRSLGKTVVVVTHDSRIFPFADRVLTMSNGQINSSVPREILNPVSIGMTTPEPGKNAA
jgi:putative ABC transport system ATP-binding protein